LADGVAPAPGPAVGVAPGEACPRATGVTGVLRADHAELPFTLVALIAKV